MQKSRALKAKRNSARAKGVTMVEGALIAVLDKQFSVYEWDEEKRDYVPTMTGILD